MAKPTLNTELVLEAPNRIADSGGGFAVDWAPVGTLWADIQTRGARERFTGARETSAVTHKITIRAAPEGSPRRPSPECRFRSGSRVFAIQGVAPMDQQGRFLTCWAAEGTPA
ncbi:MAG: head-tail adaptor protein [Pseudomonadota bacterium]